MSDVKAIADRLLIEVEGRTGYVVVLAAELRALCEAVEKEKHEKHENG